LIAKRGRGMLLDVGCGAGNIGADLIKLGFHVVGLDHSPEAVKLANARGLDARLCDLDSDGLGCQDSTFDVVWAGDVLEHVFDPIFLLKEASRVLKKDGSFYLSVPNEFPLRTRLALLIKGRSSQSFTYKTQLIDHHHTHFSLDLIDFMLAQAGLRVTWFGGILRWPFHSWPGEKLSRSRFLARNFGRAFIVVAQKDQR
jgi:SAM-dependent methyltransferase